MNLIIWLTTNYTKPNLPRSHKLLFDDLFEYKVVMKFVVYEPIFIINFLLERTYF